MSTTTQRSSRFHLPPRPRTAWGELRKAGFELEYSHVGIARSAELVREVFGGRIVPEGTFAHRVITPLGDFNVEIDTSLLKDRRYEAALRFFGLDPQKMNTRPLEDALLGLASTIIPIEIGTPPLPIDRLDPLDDLRQRLHDAGARGTRARMHYAFGMHINCQIPSQDPAELLDYIRAMILLYPLLKQRGDVDLMRSVSPYINPFPPEYAKLILDRRYVVTMQRLIEDYLKYNPTRNRPLDMLPVLAHLDAQRVQAAVEDPHLVKPRPAFHYRLPNCMVDEPDWTLADEWNRWVLIERLAGDVERLRRMSEHFLAAADESFPPFTNKWEKAVEGYVE